MKHRVGRYRFVVIASFATPVEPLPTFAISITTTFYAFKTIAPFLFYQIVQAIFLRFKTIAKFSDSNPLLHTNIFSLNILIILVMAMLGELNT